MKKNEIERKFLVSEFPKDMEIHKLQFIKQIYLPDGSRIRAVRELIYEGPVEYSSTSKLWIPPYGYTKFDFATHHIRFYRTVKTDTDNPLIRNEEEEEIPYGEYFYKHLSGHEDLIPIEKVRHYFYIGDNEASLDCYIHPAVRDLIEVEFETQEAAEAFTPPDWFSEEVTNNDDYKNKTIFRWLNSD